MTMNSKTLLYSCQQHHATAKPAIVVLLLLIVCCVATPVRLVGQEVSSPAIKSTEGRNAPSDGIAGMWVVDLRPTPDAESYTTELLLDPDSGNRLKGVYYNSKISNGYSNDVWGTTHIAFTTSDGSGIYYSSARLEDGVLRGSTLSTGRGFLSVWTATRKVEVK